MKYPYIGYWEEAESMVLFVANREGFQMEALKNYSYEWSEREYKNITPEYLQNTYGEVVSPEHAEFIIELAKVNDISVFKDKYSDIPSNAKYFSVTPDGTLYLFKKTAGISRDRKRITIPLPPKADKQESSEWPQIGDEVTWGDILVTGELKGLSKSDGAAWVKNQYGVYFNTHIDLLQKPKAPEEELRDDIQSIIFKKHAEMATSIHVRNSLIEMAKNSAEILLDEFEMKRKPH